MKLFWVFVLLILSINLKFRRLNEDEEQSDRYRYDDQLPIQDPNMDEVDEQNENEKYDVESLNDPEYFVTQNEDEEFEDEDVDEEDVEGEEGIEGEEGEEVEEEPEEPEMIEFEEDNEEEHLKNFKKISEDLQVYEDDFLKCLEKIPDSGYTQREIDLCVGKDFIKVLDDVRYESMKLLSRGDAKIRDIMIDLCYVPAGENEIKSQACDLLERDALDLLWSSLKFVEIIIANKEKYFENQGEMEKPLFRNIMIQFEKFSQEFFELLNEIDDHKEITLLKIKETIDQRTKLIKAEKQQKQVNVAQEQNHEIIIEETEELPQNKNDIEQEGQENVQEIEGENEERKRKLLSQKRKLQHNKNPLPLHKNQKYIVRQFPNKMRMMNHNGKYNGITTHGKMLQSRRKNFRDKNFMSDLSQQMLQGASKFRNVHKYSKGRNKHNMFKQKF